MLEILKVWLPFLILIGVWIFFMQRMRGGHPAQQRLITQMDAQLAVQHDIARQLDRIATALENRSN